MVGAQLLLPRLRGESVVDGHDVDSFDSLRSELVGMLDLARDLAGTRWGEGTRDTDDDV